MYELEMDNSCHSGNKAQDTRHDKNNNARTQDKEGEPTLNEPGVPGLILSGPSDQRERTAVGIEACAKIKPPLELY